MKIQITVDALKHLRNHAQQAGTLDKWADVICEWAVAADNKIGELESANAALRDVVEKCREAMRPALGYFSEAVACTLFVSGDAETRDAVRFRHQSLHDCTAAALAAIDSILQPATGQGEA